MSQEQAKERNVLAERTGSAWIVELQPQVRMWIAPWTGDPGKTCVEAWAKPFKTRGAAEAALTRARRFSPFKSARIYQSPNLYLHSKCNITLELSDSIRENDYPNETETV